jgi:hypothetical protein
MPNNPIIVDSESLDATKKNQMSSKARSGDQRCQSCTHPKSLHGPKLQCPCIVYTHKGTFIYYYNDDRTFKGLEPVTA